MWQKKKNNKKKQKTKDEDNETKWISNGNSFKSFKQTEILHLVNALKLSVYYLYFSFQTF